MRFCVGYDDSDPDPNHYWIMLNSWGITDDRPTDFRVSMYDIYDDVSSYYILWQTVEAVYLGALDKG